ncbi:MAG: hypothetical protein ABR505_11900 [Actinomycetota bacterium]
MSDPAVPDAAHVPDAPNGAAVDPAFVVAVSESLGTTPMNVKNLGFMLERLGRDCSPMQFVRELTQNAIEANLAAISRGLPKSGEVIWDFDLMHFEETGVYKVCCIDTGIGMDGEEMLAYINSLSSSAQVQSHTGNFGVGAKIAAATRNPAGVVYVSWKDGKGWMCHLWRDPNTGEYGLKQWPRPDGSFGAYVELGAEVKPDEFGEHGTKVILLGQHADYDTMNPPKGAAVPDQRWLPYYLNTRYFEFPDGITVRARESWTQPASGGDGKTGRRKVTGQHDYLEQHSVASDVLGLTGARAHWWILKDEGAYTWHRTLYLANGHAALLHKNELYEVVSGRAAFHRLQQFGVIFGQQRVVIYVEPDASAVQVETNTARTHLIVDGDAAPWQQWASEFRERMPTPIKQLVEEVAAKGAGSDHAQSIRERLAKITEVLKISRYKPAVSGNVLADPTTSAPGGRPAASAGTKRGTNGGSRGGKGGATGNIYALHQAPSGTPANEVPNFPHPDLEWVSVEDGRRPNGDMEDRAARYLPDQNLLPANADFRVFSDMVRRWEKVYDRVPGAREVIVDVVHEWFEQALVETVLGVLSLKGGREWRPDQIEAALNEEALTAAVMQRYHVEMNVRRALGSKLGALKDQIAAGM